MEGEGIPISRDHFFSQIFHPYVFPTTLFYHMQQSTQATFFQKEIFQISLSKEEGIR